MAFQKSASDQSTSDLVFISWTHSNGPKFLPALESKDMTCTKVQSVLGDKGRPAHTTKL